MELPELACGLTHMLEHALHQHIKTYQGRKPRRFELHPALKPDLYSEPRFYQDQIAHGLHGQFHGIELVFTVQASAPRLITCRNEVQYL
jgi:hypothetical protein